MNHLIRILCVVGMLAAAKGAGPSAETPAVKEIKALEQVVQEQSKRIDALTAQVAKLAQMIEARPETSSPAGESKKAGGDAAASAATADALRKLEASYEEIQKFIVEKEANRPAQNMAPPSVAEIRKVIAENEAKAPKPDAPPKGDSAPKPDMPPKAEAVPKPDPAGKHTVAKGETLTSIAKHYNIPVAELQKFNKIENDRKLQIGQVLSIPTAKTPEPSTEKKENP